MSLRMTTLLSTALLSAALVSSSADAQSRSQQIHEGVPLANQRSGHPDTVVAEGFKLVKVAEGIDPLEKPSGVINRFGLLDDLPPQPIEATRTEADENTYLEFSHNPGGPT